MTKTDPTWKDIDEIVKLRTKAGSFVSVKELETAFATDDDAKVSAILAALRGPTEEYEANIYPLSGVRLTLVVQKNRHRKWFKEDQLIINIYTQARSKYRVGSAKEEAEKAAADAKAEVDKKRKAEERAKIEEESSERAKKAKEVKKSVTLKEKVEVSEVDEGNLDIDPIPSKSTMTIREHIKFYHLQSNAALEAYVPSIDENYVFPAWTEEFVSMVDNGLNCWLYGGTGAGKSSMAEQVCATAKLPLMYQSFHEDIKPDQLFGGKDLVDGNTVWVDGPVTKAYREGFVLLLDEIDGLPPEIQFCLYGILDRKPLVLAENGNEVVKPHPNFRAIATGNTQGRGDEYGMFAGTNVLNRAFLNRYRVWYKVDYPSEGIYRKIIEKEGVTPAVARVIARLAKEINNAFMNGTLTETFSLRDAREVAKVAELAEGDIGRALQLTLLNRLSSVESAAVSEMCRRIIE